MNTKSIITLILGSLFFSFTLQGQEEKDMLKALISEDREAVETIVLYPEGVRSQIFEVSQYPELLLRLNGLQEKTAQNFKKIIEPYPQEEQSKFYEVTRYHGLTKDLAANGKKSKSEINEILKKYPQEIHQTALEIGRKEYETLHQIFNLNQTIKQNFDDLLSRYSTNTQQATKELVKMPEVLSILVDNLDQTILVGDVYKNDPTWIEEKAKELNLEVARRQAEELEDYKKQLEQDPEAYQEMLDAANLYAKDNNTGDSEYKEETTNTEKVTYSYNYWYGYPYWYTYPFWTPVPYYYHTGFYIGPGGAVVIIGLPSFHYVHWHYTFYPHMHVHLHGHYHRHYARHPHGHGGFHAAVNINVNKNINLKTNKKRGLPDKRQTNNAIPKIDKKKIDNQDFNRFKASDSHRGSWSKGKNRDISSRNKRGR